MKIPHILRLIACMLIACIATLGMAAAKATTDPAKTVNGKLIIDNPDGAVLTTATASTTDAARATSADSLNTSVTGATTLATASTHITTMLRIGDNNNRRAAPGALSINAVFAASPNGAAPELVGTS